MSLTDNIVAYWKFDDGNANDSVGTNNGVSNNITYSSANGKINVGGGYNGTNSYINMGDVVSRYGNTGLKVSTNSLTFSAWIYLGSGSNGANRQFFQARRTSLDGRGIDFFRVSTNYLQVRFTANDGTQNFFNSSNTYTYDGNWHFVVFVYNGSTGKFTVYWDANEVAGLTNVSAGKTWDLTGVTANLDIGAFGSWASTNWFLGKIDEVGLWSRVLSPSEISQLYNNGSGLQYPFTIHNFLLFFP